MTNITLLDPDSFIVARRWNDRLAYVCRMTFGKGRLCVGRFNDLWGYDHGY